MTDLSDSVGTARQWYGAPYRKWASFGAITPLESMLRLSIPILYIAGGKDHNQTILGMDYARLEFIRRGKTNLTYQVYPDCDHFLQQEQTIEGKVQRVDRIGEAHQFAVDWLNHPTKH